MIVISLDINMEAGVSIILMGYLHLPGAFIMERMMSVAIAVDSEWVKHQP